jgi:CarD family transcriptional regulator
VQVRREVRQEGRSPGRAKPGREAPATVEAAPQAADVPSIDWKGRVGALAVYPGHGVARIEEFGTKEICGQTCEFLVLRMQSGSSRIWIPLQKIGEVGLRPLVARDDARKIWSILRTRPRGRSGRSQTWIRQFREFQERIKTESIFGVAEVLRDLMLLQREKELSFGEHRVLDSARTLVAEELAAVEEREVSEVLAEIKATLR